MGKTAVFVLASLHQLDPVDGEIHVVVLCHTRELAYQIQREVLGDAFIHLLKSLNI